MQWITLLWCLMSQPQPTTPPPPGPGVPVKVEEPPAEKVADAGAKPGSPSMGRLLVRI